MAAALRVLSRSFCTNHQLMDLSTHLQLPLQTGNQPLRLLCRRLCCTAASPSRATSHQFRYKGHTWPSC